MNPSSSPSCPRGVLFFAPWGDPRRGAAAEAQASSGWCLVANPPAKSRARGRPARTRIHARPQQAGCPPGRPPTQAREGGKERSLPEGAEGWPRGRAPGGDGRQGHPSEAREGTARESRSRGPAAEGPGKGWPLSPPRTTNFSRPSLSTRSFVRREPCRRGRGRPLLRAEVSQARPLVPPRSPQPPTTPSFPLGADRAASPSLATLAGRAGRRRCCCC